MNARVSLPKWELYLFFYFLEKKTKMEVSRVYSIRQRQLDAHLFHVQEHNEKFEKKQEEDALVSELESRGYGYHDGGICDVCRQFRPHIALKPWADVCLDCL